MPIHRRLSREEAPVQRRPQLAVLKLAAVSIFNAIHDQYMADEDSGSKANSPTEQKSQIDFQFLNFSHPSEAKASRARRTVRSHVTRQQHQREHAAAAARRAKSAPQVDASQDDVEQEESPRPMIQAAATFPPGGPTLQLPTRPALSTAESDASSQSPSPTGSPSTYRPEHRINPYELYPSEWHPYLPAIMVTKCIQHDASHLLTLHRINTSQIWQLTSWILMVLIPEDRCERSSFHSV